MEARSHGSSRVTAEYDPFGQVIITEAGGKHSLRSRSSIDDVHTSVLPPDDARSQRCADRPGLTTADTPSPVSAECPATPPSLSGPQYLRRADSLEEEAKAAAAAVVSGGGGGTVSTVSSSLLRRIGRRRTRDEDSDSDSTTRCSDLGPTQSKRGGARRRKHRRKRKHKGQSIDKHSDATRRYSAPDAEMKGPDNEYWRGLVAEQHRRSSLDVAARRRHRRSSPKRRSIGGGSEGSAFSRRPLVNGTSAVPAVATGTAEQLEANGNVRRQSEQRRTSSMSKTERDCCGSVIIHAVMFVVVGCLLVIVGVIRIFICFWHEFGSSVWSGALVS